MNFAARNQGFELTALSRMRRPYTFSGISFCCVWYTSHAFRAWQHAIPSKCQFVHVHVRAFKLTWWRDSRWFPFSFGWTTTTATSGLITGTTFPFPIRHVLIAASLISNVLKIPTPFFDVILVVVFLPLLFYHPPNMSTRTAQELAHLCQSHKQRESWTHLYFTKLTNNNSSVFLSTLERKPCAQKSVVINFLHVRSQTEKAEVRRAKSWSQKSKKQKAEVRRQTEKPEVRSQMSRKQKDEKVFRGSYCLGE